MIKEIAEALGALLVLFFAVFSGLSFHSLRTTVKGLGDDFTECRKSRETCQAAMKLHHENSGMHRNYRDDEILEDIRNRLSRIENYIMKIASNGKSV